MLQLGTNDPTCADLKIRYGVIDIDDMLRDLEHWETLLTSSFMQRPHEILINGGPEIEEHQKINLVSAVSQIYNCRMARTLYPNQCKHVCLLVVGIYEF